MLETDYLVIGAGAMGMAFADTLLTETDASVLLVDQHAKPGGHWNDAYPFVRLHQPSAFYGVNSKPMGSGQRDRVGWNAGLYELASGAEVVAYFDQVMQQQFLPSGRVQYFPMCRYEPGDDGSHRFVSLVTGDEQTVEVNRKLVDASYMNVQVPSVRGPLYERQEGVRCRPLNDLPRAGSKPDGYTVVGAGKTGMDACLWLLTHGVDPDLITWIMPRDSWILDRANIQPGEDLYPKLLGNVAHQYEAIAESKNPQDMFSKLEERGCLIRLDPGVEPTMYRCATVTTAELEQLKKIRNIVRKGRVTAIGRESIELTDGTIPTTPNTLHVDCSADALERRPVLPVFDSDRVTLQTVRPCQQVFSAAFIAHLEAAYGTEAGTDAAKNDLARVIPHPNSDVDFLRSTLQNAQNAARWGQDEELSAWLESARLDGFTSKDVVPSEADLETLGRIRASTPEAMARLEMYLAAIDAT